MLKAKEWRPNLHAHLIFDWTEKSGISIKLNRSDMKVRKETVIEAVKSVSESVKSLLDI